MKKILFMTILIVIMASQCTGRVVESLKDCSSNPSQPGCEDYYDGLKKLRGIV